jgi:RNA polymerase sigma factor (sigma-70 family)
LLGSNSGSADTSCSRDPIATNGANLPAAILEAPIRASRARATDEELARAARRGDTGAFEALYERHHRPLLSFARHMLGDVQEAEDVVQHAFLAADRQFRSGKIPKAVRAWLYTVARNRCVSLLRARREAPGLPDAGTPSIENLAAEVERREDLRHLLADLRGLPDAQRAALLLAELGDLSHAEVATVIGVRPGKVKALVYQARQTLMAAADARAIPCRSIQEELAVSTGAALRQRHLQNHVARCAGCREYADRVRSQRASLALVLPVLPTLALRDAALSGLTGSAGAAATAGGVGLLAVKSTAAKLLTVAVVGGAAAGGGTVAITHHGEARDGAVQLRQQRAPSAPAAPLFSTAVTPGADSRPALDQAAPGRPPQEQQRSRADAGKQKAPRDERSGPATIAPRGHANGHRPTAARTPPGQAKTKPGHVKSKGKPAKPKPPKASKPANPKPPKASNAKPRAAKPASRGKPVPKAKPAKSPKPDSAPPVSPASDAPGQVRKQAKNASEQPAP